jgi:hypothetical protein
MKKTINSEIVLFQPYSYYNHNYLKTTFIILEEKNENI